MNLESKKKIKVPLKRGTFSLTIVERALREPSMHQMLQEIIELYQEVMKNDKSNRTCFKCPDR